MKTYLLSACIAALATASYAADSVAPTPEAAIRHVSGYGEIYGAGVWIDEFDEGDIWGFGGAARINVPFAERWNAQGDLVADAIDFDDTRVHGIGGVFHLNWRNPASYALGGFAEFKTYGISEATDQDIWDWKVGPEAQVYFANLTLYGQAYYGGLEAELLPYDVDLMGVRGVVRYFAQDDLRFDAELGFHRTSLSVGGFDADFDTVAVALQATYRFTDTPWAVFARYQYENVSFSEASDSLDLQKLSIGLRASFGSTTLLDQDRNGATMDTYRPNFVLPLIGG